MVLPQLNVSDIVDAPWEPLPVRKKKGGVGWGEGEGPGGRVGDRIVVGMYNKGKNERKKCIHLLLYKAELIHLQDDALGFIPSLMSNSPHSIDDR